MSKRTAIIIGAGYGGMALANLLAKTGYDVTVYEKNQTAGGRINAIQQSGYTFDIGPSWYLMPEVFESYYQLFDQSPQDRLDLIRFSPGYRVFFENKAVINVQADLKKDKNLFESIEPGAGATLERYVATSSLAYQLSLRYFLYNNFRRVSDFLHWPIIKALPRLISLTSQHLDSYVSKFFHDQRLKQLLEYHMVFLGSSPFQAPAIYTLMSHLDFVSGVYYPRGGMLSVAEDMKNIGVDLPVRYVFNSGVKQIIIEGGKAVGIHCSDGTEARADIIVSNADLHHTETSLIEKPYRSFPEAYWKKRQPGPGALLVSIGVRGALPELSHHNLFFVDKWRQNFEAIYDDKIIPERASMYVCNPTKTDPSLAPANHENLFFLIPIPAAVELSDDEQDTLASTSIAAFAKASGISDLAERIVEQTIFGPQDFKAHYNAWQSNAFGGESHILSQSILFRTPNKSRKVKNLYYVGAGTLPGIGLPMCLISAQLTFKQIVGNKKAGPLTKEDL